MRNQQKRRNEKRKQPSKTLSFFSFLSSFFVFTIHNLLFSFLLFYWFLVIVDPKKFFWSKSDRFFFCILRVWTASNFWNFELCLIRVFVKSSLYCKHFFLLVSQKVHFLTNKSIFWSPSREKIVCNTGETLILLVWFFSLGACLLAGHKVDFIAPCGANNSTLCN